MPKIIEDEVGFSGLDFDQSTGSINEEFLRDLQWPSAGDTYKEMISNDPTVGAMLFAIEMLLRGLEWTAEAASDSTKHESEAELLHTIMHDMEKPWVETIVDILSFLPYGFSIFEPVFKIRRGPLQSNKKFKSKHSDGKFGIRKLAGRSQTSIDKWEFEGDEVVAVHQWHPAKAERSRIPRDKYLHFRVNSKRDNPESQSILRAAYRPWFIKKNIEESEAVGISRDLAGIPVMTAPVHIMTDDASPGEKALFTELQKIVTRIHNNEQAGVIYPAIYDESGRPLVELKLLNSGGQRQFDTDKIIQRYSSQIAQTVLADFIMLGQTTFGSFALSSNKTKLFAAALGSWIRTITDTLNNELIPKLAKLNNWDVANPPRIVAGDLESRDLEIVADYFSKLAKEGLVSPDDSLEGFLRDTAEAPKIDKTSADRRLKERTELNGKSNKNSNKITNSATDAGKPTGDAIA